MATLEEVTKVMAFLAALWPRESITMPTIKAYAMILKDVPADAVAAAAEAIGSEASPFFPKAGEIRQRAFELTDGDDLPLAMEGWQQLADKWRGRYVEFWPLTERTIQAMGGMRRLGTTTEKDLPFIRAQFIKTFETFRNRAVEDRRMLPVVKEFKQLQAGKVDDALKQLARKLAVDGD